MHGRSVSTHRVAQVNSAWRFDARPRRVRARPTHGVDGIVESNAFDRRKRPRSPSRRRGQDPLPNLFIPASRHPGCPALPQYEGTPAGCRSAAHSPLPCNIFRTSVTLHQRAPPIGRRSSRDDEESQNSSGGTTGREQTAGVLSTNRAGFRTKGGLHAQRDNRHPDRCRD